MKAVTQAARILLRGGVVAYPTEGVYGLGCAPDDAAALEKLLAIKGREPGKGLILIGADSAQLEPWIDLPAGRSLPNPDPGHPVTWIVPPAAGVHPLVCGDNPGLAVRITGNPTAAALCRAAGLPITSTSANLSGQPTARNRWVLRRQFASRVDYVVPGDCGPASGPSEIRDFLSGKVLRPRWP